MEIFNDLYENGLTYPKYLAAASHDRAASYAIYLESIEIEQPFKTRILDIHQKVKLLVFCDINCNDCRITLAVMERMRQINANLSFRIVNRNENRNIMEQYLGCIRIPQIVIWNKNDFRVIYNEYPDAVHKSLKGAADEERLMTVVKYRNGGYNDYIIVQLVEAIEKSLI